MGFGQNSGRPGRQPHLNAGSPIRFKRIKHPVGVHPRHRGRGLTTVLTKAAIAFARDRGGRILEAHPWETAKEKYPTIVYTGLASTFKRLGFEVVQRRAPHKPMMRLALR